MDMALFLVEDDWHDQKESFFLCFGTNLPQKAKKPENVNLH
jgi:hypothetical protein